MTSSRDIAADVWRCGSCTAPIEFQPLPDGSGSFAICSACGDPCVRVPSPLPQLPSSLESDLVPGIRATLAAILARLDRLEPPTRVVLREKPARPSVPDLMKARFLALIDAEFEEEHPSLARLRRAVEQMEIPT